MSDFAKELLAEVTSEIDPILLNRPGLTLLPMLSGSLFTALAIYGFEEALEQRYAVDLNDPASLDRMERWVEMVAAGPDEEHDCSVL